MNKIFTLLLIFCFCFFASHVGAQNYNLYWDKTFGGTSRDWNSNVSVNSEGELFIVGDSQSDISGDKSIALCNTPNPNSDIWLLKLDTSGAILWQKAFGGASDERLPQLHHLNNVNKEMLLVCHSTSDISCTKTEPNRDTIPLLSADYWVCLLDSSGNIIWDKTLGGDNFDDYLQATQLSSGEFIIGGESNSPVGYDKSVANYSISNDIWTIQLNASGTIIGDNVFGGDGVEYLSAIIPDSNGNFLIAGSTASDISGDVSQTGQGNLDYWMIKVDGAGNKIWDKRFGGSGPDRCNYATRTTDNGYILCGFTVSPQDGDVSEAPKGIQDYWIVKTDSAGNKLWDRRFGGSGGSFGSWIKPAPGSGYWMGGYSNSGAVLDVSEPSYGGSDYWIIKTDESGNKLFDKRFGGNTDDFFTSMAILSDSTMMAFGYSDSGSSAVKTAQSKGWMDYWMVKFSYTDTITSLPDHNNFLSESKIIPNPSNGSFIYEFQLQENTEMIVEIYDLTGKLVFNSNLTFITGYHSYPFALSHLESGIYYITTRSASQFLLKQEKIIII